MFLHYLEPLQFLYQSFPFLTFTVEYQKVLNKWKVGTKGIQTYGKLIKCQ